MPIPDGKEHLFGMIIGHMINTGKSYEESKSIAERAVMGKKKKPAGKKKPY